MTRLSQAFLPTLKDPPADAEAVSHKLMVRAGLIRQLGAGLWTYLPAGWRAQRKVEAIIREEMKAIGCQEMLLPLVDLMLPDKNPLRDDTAKQLSRKHYLPLTSNLTVTLPTPSTVFAAFSSASRTTPNWLNAG